MTDLTRVSTAMIAGLPLISGGATQSLESILLERVSVKRFGAVGDGTHDDTAAIQAAITWAIAHGARLHVPRGRYKVTATLTADMSANTGDSGNRFWMEGEGQSNTILAPTSAVTSACLNIIGGGTGAGMQAWSGISGIGFEGTSINIGAAVAGENLAYFRMDAIRIYLFQRGCYFQDTLTSLFEGVNIRYCKYGFLGERKAGGDAYGSDPNALTFINCTFGLCQVYGVLLIQGAGNSFVGCTFEGIGIPDLTGGDGATGWCVKLVSMGREGVVGAAFRDCYIENNAVSADFIIEQAENHAAYKFSGCTFARISSANYSVNNIRVTTSGTSRATVDISGCGFKALGSYTESSSRKYLDIQPHPLIEVNLGEGNLFGSNVASPYGRTPRTFRAAMTAGQSMPNATATKIAFASGEINDNLWFDTSGQVFHAYARCRMHFTAQLWFADVPDGGDCSVTLVRNNAAGGTTTVASNGIFSRGAGTCVSVSTIVNMEEGDTMEVRGYQNSGGTRNVYGDPHLSYFIGTPV